MTALAAALATLAYAASDSPSSSGGATAQAQEPGAKAPGPERYRESYARWRGRLQRHDLFVGRDLLPDARAAGRAESAVSTTDVRRSIARMQKRWQRWLDTTARGRSVVYRLKVRDSVPAWGRQQLRSIAACESHGNPRAVGGGGAYRGMYQFSTSTWSAVGGSGDPVTASRWEQTWRAWLLLSRHGAAHWPACG